MLTITKNAATLIHALTDDARLSPAAGLRIIVDSDHHSLSMGLAEGPAPADSVVSKAGARVFLSPAAARRLDTRTLQADLTDDRSVFFLDR